MTKLKINEVFFSLQGEGRHSGLPCVFIRTTGCPLRCTYCDTAYAFHEGSTRTVEDLIDTIAGFPSDLVQITGGEPLAQPRIMTLIHSLLERGKTVLLETSGALSISDLPPEVHVVLDVKTPGSAEVDRNLWENFTFLKPSDEIKFVITSDEDLFWAFQVIEAHHLDQRFEVLISPVQPNQATARWADLVLERGLKVRFQLQLHKQIWGDVRGK
jgi:7-carboxy-7-deazaguanine synthase